MNKIDESLKSARLIHCMIMIVCATTFATVVSQRGEKDYSEAIAEINAISKINLTQFIDSSLKQVKTLAEEIDLVSVYQKAFDSALKHQLEKEGINYPPNQFLNHEVFLPAFNEEYVKSLLHNGTIEDYRNFIAENIGIEFVFVQPEYLAEAFVKKIKELDIPTEGKINGVKLVISPPLYSDNILHLKMILIIAVLKSNEGSNIGSHMIIVEDPPVSLKSTFDKTRFQDWLNDQQLLNEIVNKVPSANYYTAESILPKLRFVWSLVADKVPEEAKHVLQKEIEKSGHRVSFFGIEINANMLIFAVPLLSVVLFIYFWSYVGHLKRIYKTDIKSLKVFPWLPLFPDRISRLFFFVSILILPIATFGLLLTKFRNVGLFSLSIAILFTIVTIALAYKSWCQVLVIRECIKTQSEAENSGGNE